MWKSFYSYSMSKADDQALLHLQIRDMVGNVTMAFLTCPTITNMSRRHK